MTGGADARWGEPDRPTEATVLAAAEQHAEIVELELGSTAATGGRSGEFAAEDEARRRRAALAADPGAAEVVDALDRTRADLADASGGPAPPHLLAGLDRALARERAASPVPEPTTPERATREPATPEPRVLRPARRRATAAALGAVAAVAAAVVATVAIVTTSGSGGPARPRPPVAAPPGSGVPTLAPADLPSALRGGLGGTDYGPLADPARLASCLDAHGVPAGVQPLGARQVVVAGTPGVLLVLPTGVAARFRLLVVGSGCPAGAPLTLADTVVGR